MACNCIVCGKPCDCDELFCAQCIADISDKEIEEMEELKRDGGIKERGGEPWQRNG